MHGEKARWKLHKNATCYFQQILEATPNKAAAVWPLTSHLTSHSSKTNKTCVTLIEKQRWTHKQHSSMDLQYMDVSVLANHQGHTYISSVQILNVVWRTCQKWWMMRERERGSGKSMLSAWLDNDEISKVKIIMEDLNEAGMCYIFPTVQPGQLGFEYVNCIFSSRVRPPQKGIFKCDT